MNRALAMVGASRLTSPLDNSKEARACNEQFPLVRDAELRAHVWSFAMKRATLASNAVAPTFGYNYAYTLPVDCVRVWWIGDTYLGFSMTDYRVSPDQPYQIEGRAILSNDIGPLHVRYVATTENPTAFDACFAEAVACRLAMAIVTVLTESTVKKADLREEYKLAIIAAITANAVEKPPVPTPDDTWIMARIGG